VFKVEMIVVTLGTEKVVYGKMFGCLKTV